jgi:hypothetical protein
MRFEIIVYIVLCLFTADFSAQSASKFFFVPEPVRRSPAGTKADAFVANNPCKTCVNLCLKKSLCLWALVAKKSRLTTTLVYMHILIYFLSPPRHSPQTSKSASNFQSKTQLPASKNLVAQRTTLAGFKKELPLPNATVAEGNAPRQSLLCNPPLPRTQSRLKTWCLSALVALPF